MPDFKLRILVLLIPPVCLFLAFRHRLDDYSLPDLPSVSLPFYHSSSSVRQSCTPEQWSNGAWVARKRTTGVEDGVFAASQFEGCASNFAPTWHLGTFPEEVLTQKRFDKGGYEWVPTDDCFMKPFAKEDLIRDLVESGGWMLIGDSLEEGHMFSLSCMLYPHVVHTPTFPKFEGKAVDSHLALPQELYLNPTSPLTKSLKFPPNFDIAKTPLVSFRRTDLLFSRPELQSIYESLFPPTREVPKLFGSVASWDRPLASYLEEFLQPLPKGNYRVMIANTGGHWTDGLLATKGMELLVGFFKIAMNKWVEEVKIALDTKKGGAGKVVIVRPYVPGHVDCADALGPLREVGVVKPAYNWEWIDRMNEGFKDAISKSGHGRIHYLDIIRPARLRPDSHLWHDCLHNAIGVGVVEGWTQYIQHYLSAEI